LEVDIGCILLEEYLDQLKVVVGCGPMEGRCLEVDG
jgi:hypothetical protein